MKLCISNGIIVNPKTEIYEKGNVYADKGIILCVETESRALGVKPVWRKGEFREIKADGLLVTPGLIDLHVHFREPGFEYKEDIESGMKAAAHGGFTAVCTMPNTKPITDDWEMVKYIRDRAETAGGISVLPVGSITKGQKGTELCDFGKMKEAGAWAFSEDGRSVSDPKVMKRAMESVAALDMLIMDHAEDENETDSRLAEVRMTERDIALAEETGCRFHLCHMSTRESMEAIRKAKREGIRITAETAPHYFTLCSADINGDGNKKMNPPLREKEDIEAVKRAILDGTIDAIATDHAPHGRNEKENGYQSAMNGIIGLETSFPVSYTALVKTGLISVSKLIELMSQRPAEILKREGGDISPGKPADIAVLDVDSEYTIDEKEFFSKSVNCPFVGMKVSGRAVYTIAGGNVVWEDKGNDR